MAAQISKHPEDIVAADADQLRCMGKLVKGVNVEQGRPMIANDWTLHHYGTFKAALRLTETEPENAPAPERAAGTQDRPASVV